MGRKRKAIDPLVIHQMASRGMTQKEIALDLGISHVTLAKRIGELQAKEGLLLKYRSIQTLQLTELQARILEAVTPEKIEKASLLDLVKAFKILKSAELGITGQPLKITGLVGYLVELETKAALVAAPKLGN